jgi:hypothetical protein
VLDRTVTGFTNLYEPVYLQDNHPTDLDYVVDENGDKIYTEQVRDELGRLITIDNELVLDETTGRQISGRFPYPMLDKYGEEIPIKPTIKPYKYNYSYDVAADVVRDLFGGDDPSTSRYFTLRFGNIPENVPGGSEEGAYDITFTMGGYANLFTTENNYITVSEAEESMRIRFTLDSTRGISHKGKDARFYIKIPGFGLGEGGQQYAKFDAHCEEAYILGFEVIENETAKDFKDWGMPYAHSNNIQALEYQLGATTNESYYVRNPYEYIKLGGIPLPTEYRVYVGTKDALEELNTTILEARNFGNTEEYLSKRAALFANPRKATDFVDVTDSIWSGSFGNRLLVHYNKEVMRTTFRLDLDGQTHSVEVHNSPNLWTIPNPTLFREATRTFSMEEVILLPSSVRGDLAHMAEVMPGERLTPSSTIDIRSNDGLRVSFDGGIVEFTGFRGGGTYRNRVNKWSFDEVNWFDTQETQKAYLQLGGRGGQVIEYEFNVRPEKVLLMNTVDNMISLEVGKTTTLQKTFKQVFAGSTYSQSRTIPLEYTFNLGDTNTRIFSVIEDSFDDDEDAKTVGLSVIGDIYSLDAEIQISAQKATPSQFRQPSISQDDPTPVVEQGYAGIIYWDATTVRAYPSPEDPVGGEIYLTAYEDPSSYTNGEGTPNNSLFIQGVGLYHPATSFGHGMIAPQLPPEEQWRYVGLDDQGVMTVGDRTQTFPAAKYKSTVVQQGLSEQIRWSPDNQYPRIEIASGTPFSLQYLPMMSMRDHIDPYTTSGGFLGIQTIEVPGHDYDYMYPVDWRSATVYRTTTWSPTNFGTQLVNNWRDIVTYTEGRAMYYTFEYSLRLGHRQMKLYTVLRVNP